MAIINKSTNYKCWGGKMWRKGNPFALLVGMQVSLATVENSMKFPQKIKMKLLYDPEILLPRTYLKKPKHSK